MRLREDDTLASLARNQPLKIDGARYNDPHTKANVILQCHYSRRDVGREMEADQVSRTLTLALTRTLTLAPSPCP